LVAPVAFSAEAGGDKNVAVQEAIKNTEIKLLEAKELLEKGGNSEQILQALTDARQHQKEFRYEQTERTRQKLNNKLTDSRKAFEANDNNKALADVTAALTLFLDMKKIYEANH
jgi:hypothetical protein